MSELSDLSMSNPSMLIDGFGTPAYSLIVPHLYQGAFPDWYAIPDDVKVVVSCSTGAPPFVSDRQHIHCPFDDDVIIPDKTKHRILQTAAWVGSFVREKTTVLVHCRAGINRSSLITALAIKYIKPDVRMSTIIELIRTNRDKACLMNEEFERYLYKFERGEW